MSAAESAPALSVVIPFYNEAGNIAPLLADLRAALTTLAVPAEVICIDDGSRDSTAATLDEAARAWPALRVERFPQNRGQAAALRHGFASRWSASLAPRSCRRTIPPADGGGIAMISWPRYVKTIGSRITAR